MDTPNPIQPALTNPQDLHGKGVNSTEFWLMGVLPQVIAGASWLAAHSSFIPGLPPWAPVALTAIAQVASIAYGLMRTNVKTTAMNTVASVAQTGTAPAPVAPPLEKVM